MYGYVLTCERDDSKISTNVNLLTIFRNHFSAAYLNLCAYISELKKKLGNR